MSELERALEWLRRELKASKAPVKVLATGSEWETYSQPDSWAKFLRERNEFFDWLKAEKVTGVIFLSGDRHFSAAYHILDRYVELTSGPLGSGNATLRPNPERFSGNDEGKMWMVLEIDTSNPEPAIAYELWQAGGGLLERREITWASINGAEKIERSPYPLKPRRMEPKAATPRTR